jgi:protocatechuate 3,4-dioxygenase beta subunit
MHHDLDNHDRGLAFDLPWLIRRRRVLGLLAGAGLATLVGCTEDPASDPGPAAGGSGVPASGSPASPGRCATIPPETAGPFPGDGSNGPNVLTRSGVVRSDIRSSFGSATGVADGVPLTITLTLVNAAKGCTPFPGAAVYLWHCDRVGRYSLYSAGATQENYLRGVQAAGADGVVRFTSIFPAAYQGRWPHAHFEVFPSLAGATAAGKNTTVSQLALPKAVCEEVYATDAYATSRANLSRITLENDSVFRDGAASQLATVTGSLSSGFVASLVVAV